MDTNDNPDHPPLEATTGEGVKETRQAESISIPSPRKPYASAGEQAS